MYEYINATEDPGFSTLEVNHRGEFSTLQVKPAEGIEPFNAPASTSQKYSEELSRHETKKPWWRRYWLVIIVFTLLVSGGIIGGAVGGTLASKKEADGKDNVAENATISRQDTMSVKACNMLISSKSHDSTSTTPTPSRASSITSTSTTASYPTIIPTAIPGPTDVPDDPI
ncbi:unnamed protein product [Fusarium venenatum]|uniref:Uncharacterized protein n=1 Tax=Fusarium venenatum TaxID=56646 RepID=A0A2L2T1M1_9HYPO|nr:uncharacterized protein FVRRES_07745 [Fusarium venenatum]CEI63309.1 unnamed protein product [Fusarium venenatum]